MKPFRVRLAVDAELDLIDIYNYVARSDSIGKAVYLLGQLETLCSRLATLPRRGHIPPELERIGVATFREVHFKPYHVIYEIIRQDAFMHCVLDGRRDMQSLLQRRLLR